MTAFNDLIGLLRGRVSVYHNARVCGDWIIQEHALGNTCFHMATQGGCRLAVPGHGDWVLGEGDLVIFPRELPHTLTPARPQGGSQRHLSIAEAQHLEGTSMLCGAVQFEHRCGELLLDTLPAVFVIQCAPATGWLVRLLALILEESLRDSRTDNLLLNRLCELLFAFALRHYAESQGGDEGIMALFVHPRISGVLQAVHAAPEKDWQLQSLAACAAMSRTHFAKVFKDISGLTPMQYVTWWRMQIAWSCLEDGGCVAEVGHKVGYRSEAAFSRAFSKHFAISAGAVRRGTLGVSRGAAAPARDGAGRALTEAGKIYR